ncbi:Alpha/Beta hydrolase protein [Hyaloraphidium curvatum]|nr:Alpha/Beta hydrolase protein [Hyaloraphidium curvatum]
MAIYVLVHGGWAGAHGWRHVRKLLQAAGHQVFTPSLTGIGERAHLASPTVDLSVHVLDVVNCILYEDLTDIVLVGFSYGGFVVTGALEHVADRVRELVYLDAFVPSDGDSVASLTRGALVLQDPAELGAPWLVPSPPREFYDPAEAAFSLPRRVSHPVRCFTERVKLAKPLEESGFGLTYVFATEWDSVPALRDAADKAKAKAPRWRYLEVACNHMLPNNKPDETAKILLDLA